MNYILYLYDIFLNYLYNSILIGLIYFRAVSCINLLIVIVPVANLWLRERGQEFRWPCSTNEDE